MPDNPRWKRRPAGSNWGDWGPDDQLGRLNLLTPDKVLKGGAWETRSRLANNTYRNFFQPYRRDIFAGFRTCALSEPV